MSLSFRSFRKSAAFITASSSSSRPSVLATASASATTPRSGTRRKQQTSAHHVRGDEVAGSGLSPLALESKFSSSVMSSSSLLPTSPSVNKDVHDSKSSSRGINNKRRLLRWCYCQHFQSPTSPRVVLLVGFFIVQFCVLLSIQVFYASGWRRWILYNHIDSYSVILPSWMMQQLHIQQRQKQEGSAGAVTSTMSNTTATTAAVASTTTTTTASAWTVQRHKILSLCGPLCNTSRPIITTNSLGYNIPNFGYFGLTTAPMDCPALFESTILDEAGNFPQGQSPRQPPIEFIPDYTMHGHAIIENWYIRENLYFGQRAKQAIWKRELVEEWKHAALQGLFEKFGNYQIQDRQTLYDALNRIACVKNQTVLVLGSETPWVEALCLAAGARHVTTLEYGTIISHHEQITTYTPATFRQAYLDGTLGMFDAIVSYSSLEHSGLGRYGDALNPFGDLLALARAWCVTMPGGSLTLGVSSGPVDKVYFNAGRIYSIHRWPYLVTNWLRVNYSSGWASYSESWWRTNTPKLQRRLRGPPGHEIFWNQSALVFRKTGPTGTIHELHDYQLLEVPS